MTARDAGREGAAHTAGPWTADLDGEIIGPGGQSIAMVLLNEQGAANARLIAAAPELVAALRELIVASDAYDESAAADRRIKTALDRARAILAKAEGRQP